MTYDAREQSQHQGNPVYLYRFTQGATHFDYCSLPSNLPLTSPVSSTFLGSSVDHGKIFVGQSPSKDQLDIVFPLSDTFAQRFLKKHTSFAPTAVTIWRGHLDDPDDEFRVIFKGKVRAGKPLDNTKIVLLCASFYSSLKKDGVGSYIHRSCRHSLYFGGCGLNKADFEVAATVSAINGTVCTVTEAAGQADGFYTAGVLEYDNELIFITNHVGNKLTLRHITQALSDQVIDSGSAAVMIAPGCDKALTTCINKFDNKLNFGGFPFMPDNDPWNDGRVA